MAIATNRAQRRQLAKENMKQPVILQEIPRSQWPNQAGEQKRVLRSRDFLVQEFSADLPAIVRLSINRTLLSGERWEDGITWDELQSIKMQCGYGDFDAMEIYPADRDIVNVANMRHLWIMASPLKNAWRNG